MTPQDAGSEVAREAGREGFHARLLEGWEQVAAGLRQVRKGAAIALTALAAEGVRVAVEHASALAVLAATRLARRVLERLGRLRPPT